MANYQSKTNVPVAVKSRSQQDLSHVTIATQDFGVLTPISCQYLVPGDKFNINVGEVTRLMPIPNPTYCKVDMIIRAFAVPISYVWKPFNDFVSGNVHYIPDSEPAIASKVPTFTVKMLVDALVSLQYCDEVFTTSFDFAYSPDTSETKTYVLNYNGRIVMKYMRGLGYNFDINVMSDGQSDILYNKNEYSVLPIMAFIKFYLDWVVPARYIDQFSELREVLEGFLNKPNGDFPDGWFEKVLKFIPLSFLDNDYFTSAWKYPASPENGMSTFKVPDVFSVRADSTITSRVYKSVEQGAFIPTDEIDYAVSSLSLQSVGALQSMLNRGMITGNKVKDWLRTEFGVTPSMDALQTSSYLGMHRHTVQIGDVYSTSDTEAQGGAALGAYSGRGHASGGAQFQFNADDQHCILIITSEIIPKPLYYQGMHPLTKCINRFDFFQPEFDNVGVRAIQRDELFADCQAGVLERSGFYDGIFGFAPQYSNLKTGYDNIIGDFRLGHFRDTLDSWFLARRFKDPANLIATMGNISTQFCLVNGTTQQEYDKMFDYQGTDIDHFYSFFDVQISANRPMVSVSDALTLEDEKNARKVSVSTNNNPNV